MILVTVVDAVCLKFCFLWKLLHRMILSVWYSTVCSVCTLSRGTGNFSQSLSPWTTRKQHILNWNCKSCMGTLLENWSGLTCGWEDNIRSLLGLKWLTNGLNGKFVVLVECHSFKEVFYTPMYCLPTVFPIDVMDFRILFNHSIYWCGEEWSNVSLCKPLGMWGSKYVAALILYVSTRLAEWSASQLGSVHRSHWIGRWMGPRASMDAFQQRNMGCLYICRVIGRHLLY